MQITDVQASGLRRICRAVLAGYLLAQVPLAGFEQAKVEKKMEHHLPGYTLALSLAATECQEIVVGPLVEPGHADFGAPGQLYYSGAKLTPTKWLKGRPPEAHTGDPLVFAYTVQKVPASEAEDELQKGTTYLFFFTVQDKSSPRAVKITAADEESIRRIEKMIAGQRH